MKSLSDLVNNFVLIIFKTCKYSYKKNNVIVYSHTPAMGVQDHVPCEYLQNNGVTGILMYILKTFILIHFHFCLLKNTDIE